MVLAGLPLFVADFEDASGNPDAEGFTTTGPNDQWHLSNGRGTNPGHTASHSYYFGAGETAIGSGSYSNNADGTLISPIIDLSSAMAPVTLEFNHFLDVEAGFDFATVSVLAGAVSTHLASSGTGELPSMTSGFESVTLDLSGFVGQQIQLQFRLTSDSRDRRPPVVLGEDQVGHEVRAGDSLDVDGNCPAAARHEGRDGDEPVLVVGPIPVVAGRYRR